LPAIFNPEDLNALEMALQVKEEHGGHVAVLTMGPPSAAEVLREALYRGAERAVLLTDRRFAASDTLATSYVLSCAVKKLGAPDLVFCGRQAIDGDTAQIGPQLAEKLDLAQFTYVEQIVSLEPDSIVVRRSLEGGYEVVKGPVPALLTVVATANEPRYPSARRLMLYKKARTSIELSDDGPPEGLEQFRDKGLLIEQWDADAVECDEDSCGGRGSPTRVKKIESVRLKSAGHKAVEPTEVAIKELMKELMDEHIFD